MAYAVKEIYYSLQGEGARTGRAAVFCRFAGCNLWSGWERDRATAVCDFCDTDFVGVNGPGGGRFETPEQLAAAALAVWPVGTSTKPFVVCTGGEPLLQLDAAAILALRTAGFEVALETNGTLPVPPGIDWLCVSPKAESELVVTSGEELKLVYPQAAALPEQFALLAFHYFYLQPMDGPHLAANTQAAIAYCLAHPQWRLGLQTHKLLGLR